MPTTPPPDRFAMATLPALLLIGLLAACGDKAAGGGASAASSATSAGTPASAARPGRAALTVTTTQPQTAELTLKIGANGNIAAWQEASVGTEANGLRLAQVLVNVGDVVRKGQVLARFAADAPRADLAQTQAAVAEAEATLADATVNAQRARELQATGALSQQLINQYLTAERTAQARLDAQRAAARVQRLRVKNAEVLAPDDGVISARSATVGAVLPAGQELFRLIRKGRLEWRAELPAADLARLRPGLPVKVFASGDAPGATPVSGTLRIVAPTVDAQTRIGIAYVDLAASPQVRAGMFARGEFELGSGRGLTLPQSAVQLRDGFSYVLRVGPDNKVQQTKVGIGRRAGDRIEITSGLDAGVRVVASALAFLADGDTVRVVDTPPAAATSASAGR